MTLPQIDDEVGARIAAARKARGLTLRQLGETSGVGDSMISLLETGKRRPSWETLDRLASALGIVDPFELADGIPRNLEVAR